ncbi:unnamed protein product [Lactuca virosa]|uniref:Protein DETOXIFICATION n=1 Tax=Lactuca virosa TaxID=75947 RepID=A0AAU9PD55_9ASTR|nr:unnamed protein product [Lactuca virosa]
MSSDAMDRRWIKILVTLCEAEVTFEDGELERGHAFKSPTSEIKVAIALAFRRHVNHALYPPSHISNSINTTFPLISGSLNGQRRRALPPPPLSTQFLNLIFTSIERSGLISRSMDHEIQAKLLRRDDEEEGDLKGRIWNESRKIWRVALPSVISRVCAFGTIVVTQSFIGHISDLDLAGYALVQTLSVRFVNGILLGMSSATETLCGQAFGAGQHHMMGIYLQRSWIIDLISLTVLIPIFIFAAQIFKFLGENESVANSAGHVSLCFIPFVYNFVFSLTIQMYLQAQSKNMVIAWLSIFQFGIHIPLSLLFVYKLNLGVGGAMIALSMSSWFLVIGEFVYIFGGWCPYSWRGFTSTVFKDLFPVVKLSISSGVMVCLELWYNAGLVLLAGYMENAKVSISAFSIWYQNLSFHMCFTSIFAYKSLMLDTFAALNINVWEFMISLGFLGAACVRSFSSFSGVAIGAGMQGTVAMVNFVCFYLIGIPAGALLGYTTNLKVKGIWIGMIGGVVTQTLALVYMVSTTDWDDQVKRTSNRLNRFYVKTSDNKEIR